MTRFILPSLMAAFLVSCGHGAIVSYPEHHSLLERHQLQTEDSFGYVKRIYEDNIRKIKATVSYKRNDKINGLETPSVELRVFHENREIAFCSLDLLSEVVYFYGIDGSFIKSQDGKIIVYGVDCRMPEYKGPQNVLFAFTADETLELKPMSNEEFKKYFEVLCLKAMED